MPPRPGHPGSFLELEDCECVYCDELRKSVALGEANNSHA